MTRNLLAVALILGGVAVADGFDRRIVPFTVEHMEKCSDVCLKEMRDRIPKEDYARLQDYKLVRGVNSADFEARYMKKDKAEEKDWTKYERNCHLHGNTLHCALD